MTNHKILREISKAVNGYNNAWGAELWNILTALRGPDNHSDELKDATTAVIRWYAGIPQENSGYAISLPDSEASAEFRVKLLKNLKGKDRHFVSHARGAFEALGLNWYEVNTHVPAILRQQNPAKGEKRNEG